MLLLPPPSQVHDELLPLLFALPVRRTDHRGKKTPNGAIKAVDWDALMTAVLRWYHEKVERMMGRLAELFYEVRCVGGGTSVVPNA